LAPFRAAVFTVFLTGRLAVADFRLAERAGLRLGALRLTAFFAVFLAAFFAVLTFRAELVLAFFVAFETLLAAGLAAF
jgi:hypothetical protein